MAIRHRFLLAASFLYLALANIIWIAWDTRPPFWDMAAHQIGALRIYDVFAERALHAFAAIPGLTASYPLGFYPPFYHSIVAFFYAVFGKTVDAAEWANLPAIAILFIATYGIGRRLLKPGAAAAAAVLANFYPIMLWLSRETIIDYWLTSMVALAMWLLMSTNEFANRKHSILFGVACGLGMLTKWTFPFFVVLPALWFARKNWKNAAIAAGIAAAIAAYWYVPAARSLAQFMNINSAGGVTEGDPTRLSLQAIIFYVRAMEGYQMFLPLFLLFIVGAVFLAKNFKRAWIPVLLWIGGGWLGLMLFQNKDPRYSAPLLPAAALITAQIFQRKAVLIAVLMPLLLFQHYLVSFGVPRLPPAVVLANGLQGPLSWNWNLYTQSYFDLWGPPAAEDWKIEYVLRKVTTANSGSIRLGIVPDIPRFDSIAFNFYVALLKLPVTINPVWTFDQGRIAGNDFILVSEKDQGWAPNFTRDVDRIDQFILTHPELFRLVDRFSLPNGDAIRLYRVGST